MLKAKVEEPFTVYRVLPRVAVSLSDTSLVSLDVGGNLLTYEMDLSLDFFVFFRDLVSVTVLSAMYIPLLHSYNLTQKCPYHEIMLSIVPTWGHF